MEDDDKKTIKRMKRQRKEQGLKTRYLREEFTIKSDSIN